MIGRPTPRFITHPVPPGIRALPMPIGIGTPIGLDASGDPAATMAADVFPMAIRTEGFIKIALVTDDHFDGCGLDVNRRGRRRLDRSRRRIDDWRWRPPINVSGASSQACE